MITGRATTRTGQLAGGLALVIVYLRCVSPVLGGGNANLSHGGGVSWTGADVLTMLDQFGVNTGLEFAASIYERTGAILLSDGGVPVSLLPQTEAHQWLADFADASDVYRIAHAFAQSPAPPTPTEPQTLGEALAMGFLRRPSMEEALNEMAPRAGPGASGGHAGFQCYTREPVVPNHRAPVETAEAALMTAAVEAMEASLLSRANKGSTDSLRLVASTQPSNGPFVDRPHVPSWLVGGGESMVVATGRRLMSDTESSSGDDSSSESVSYSYSASTSESASESSSEGSSSEDESADDDGEVLQVTVDVQFVVHKNAADDDDDVWGDAEADRALETLNKDFHPMRVRFRHRDKDQKRILFDIETEFGIKSSKSYKAYGGDSPALNLAAAINGRLRSTFSTKKVIAIHIGRTRGRSGNCTGVAVIPMRFKVLGATRWKDSGPTNPIAMSTSPGSGRFTAYVDDRCLCSLWVVSHEVGHLLTLRHPFGDDEKGYSNDETERLFDGYEDEHVPQKVNYSCTLNTMFNAAGTVDPAEAPTDLEDLEEEGIEMKKGSSGVRGGVWRDYWNVMNYADCGSVRAATLASGTVTYTLGTDVNVDDWSIRVRKRFSEGQSHRVGRSLGYFYAKRAVEWTFKEEM